MHISSRSCLLAASALLALSLTGCSTTAQGTEPHPLASQEIHSSQQEDSTLPQPDHSLPPPEPAVPVEPVPAPDPVKGPETEQPPDPQPEPIPGPMLPSGAYDFTQPAPEGEAVDKSYFRDAAFVGDSRTDGFLIYSGIGCGKNLTSNGLSIFKLADKKALTIGGEKYTLLEALALEQYSKVYLSLGVNELGVYNDKGFYDSYRQAIRSIRDIQPNAVIYIQGLIPVNETRVMETTKRDYLENDHLRTYNELMKQAAEEEKVVFLDLYSAFADENGQLPYEASKDGVHLNSEYCRRWLDYLQTHTVDFDTLYTGEEAPAEAAAAPMETPDAPEEGAAE